MNEHSTELNKYLSDSDDIRLFNKCSHVRILALVFLIIAFIVISICQTYVTKNNINSLILLNIGSFEVTGTLLNGFLSQIKVVIALGMTIVLYKIGTVTALILNIITAVTLISKLDNVSDPSAYLGIVIPIVTIFIIVIIFLYQHSLFEKVIRIQKHKKKIISLYGDLAAAEEETLRQNEELIESNSLLLDNEKQLNYLAYYDVLTSLPNRTMTVKTINSLTRELVDSSFYIAIFDIDNFKRINDSVGHDTGDMVIIDFANRLISAVSADDFIGRFSGDEFIIIIKNSSAQENVVKYIEDIKHAFTRPFNTVDMKFNLTASVGISNFPSDGKTSDELLKCADTAMVKAKNSGKDSVKLYSNDMKTELLNSIIIEENLMNSLDNNEIFMVFQPQYLCGNDNLRGFEALVRWNSKKLGFISPAQFIPVAENNKFINKLGSWILKSSCIKFKSMCEKYNLRLILSVNISAIQIMSSTFVDNVRDIITETGFDPSMLELEVTESVLISSIDYVTEVLLQLKEMGIKIALDDFGTGYSSLNYLQKLPIDTLKIDKSFVDNINDDKNEKVLVGSIISLVHKIGMEVIAEGVETNTQLDYLKTQRCDYIQGYILGKPLNEDAMLSLVSNFSSLKATAV